ncbi:hypothetical protein CEY16_10310 [Halalkalibacillus sediminis]|uniref:HTH gntR-type domain-containing protein n=1 Tax=Halalkalibacillus sediminis TaxID=2018042 RepID=A0A2I0QS47_9BACI|nr:GntR family transcriptional regulator [Halalkalibacillus sediminis]PKR77129.1 hypothetical protein CEY16_10310 [Halalkalibacillus sediminis]
MSENQRKIPLYMQIKSKLIDRINENEWNPGDAIPSESQLMKYYNVSRTTVRQAIRDLAQDGIIETRRGAAARLKSAPEEDVNNTGVVHHEVGEEFSVKVLRAYQADNHQFAKHQLKLDDHTDVYLLERIRIADGIPIGLQQLFTPTYIGEILEKEGFTYFDIFPVLGKHMVNYSTIKENVTSCLANQHEADLLGIMSGDPLIEITRLTLGLDHTPIEFSKTKYVPSNFNYNIEIGR